jgi:hypothetical protein
VATTDVRQIRVVVIPADASESPRTVRVAANAIGSLLGGGGPAGLLSLPGTDAQLYSNERGRDLGLPPNPRATRFAVKYIPGFAHADMILGPVVIVGISDDGLEGGDVPAEVEASALDAR